MAWWMKLFMYILSFVNYYVFQYLFCSFFSHTFVTYPSIETFILNMALLVPSFAVLIMYYLALQAYLQSLCWSELKPTSDHYQNLLFLSGIFIVYRRFFPVTFLKFVFYWCIWKLSMLFKRICQFYGYHFFNLDLVVSLFHVCSYSLSPLILSISEPLDGVFIQTILHKVGTGLEWFVMTMRSLIILSSLHAVMHG